MRIIVITNENLKVELISKGQAPESDIIWLQNAELPADLQKADAVFDLMFENHQPRIELLKQMTDGPVIINSVIHTLSETEPSFIRINAWPTFLQTDLIEASCGAQEQKPAAEKLLALFNKDIAWVNDMPGFVTARVIAMIINEAFIALGEGVSTRHEIDTAMKLGTNYPYGPFEWAEKIGHSNIHSLLMKLSITQSRYFPAKELSALAE